MIAEGTRQQLVAELGEDVRIELTFGAQIDPRDAESVAKNVPGTRRAQCVDGKLHVFTSDGSASMPALLQAMLEARLAPSGVVVVEPDLEDVFLELTGRALRD